MCAACEFLVSGTLCLFVCLLYVPWAQLRIGVHRHYYYDDDYNKGDNLTI